jgi:hypothetical protein
MTENDLRVLDTLETDDYITGELLQVGAFRVCRSHASLNAHRQRLMSLRT